MDKPMGYQPGTRGLSLTVFDTKRSLDDTARADDGTARNTRETHLSKVSGMMRTDSPVDYRTGRRRSAICLL